MESKNIRGVETIVERRPSTSAALPSTSASGTSHRQQQPVLKSLHNRQGTMFMPQSSVPGYSTPQQVQLPLVDGSEAPVGAVYYYPDGREEEDETPGHTPNQQPAPNGNLGYGGTANSDVPLRHPKPNNFIPFSVVTCLFCNPLFGIVAIYFSVMSDKAYERGDLGTSTKNGHTALGVAILGMVLSGVVVALLLLTGAFGNKGFLN